MATEKKAPAKAPNKPGTGTGSKTPAAPSKAPAAPAKGGAKK